MHGTLARSAAAPGARPLDDAPGLGWLPFLGLAFRLALRDLRGGIRGFGILIACLALGVGAIATVNSVARGVGEGLNRQGRLILGGDAAVSLIQREATAPELAFLESVGEVSRIVTLRAMAVAASGESALVELKAVDDAYPAVGTLETEPALEGPPAEGLLGPRDDRYGAVADPVLLARLGLAPGDRIRVGSAELELRAAIVSEPDKLAAGFGLAPRLLISVEALRATALIQPGSLARFTYRILLPGSPDDPAQAATLANLEARAKAALPDAGWEVRTRSNADPRFARNVDRFTQFLTLVGITALLVGGVGVANAVRRFVDIKRLDFATLKALGAPGGRVVTIHLMQVLLMAAVGVVIGLAIGSAAPFLLASALQSVLPVPLVPTIAWGELAMAAGYGLITGLVFAVLPLGRAHDVPVSALFRDTVEPDAQRPRLAYIAAFVLALAALAAITIAFAFDPRISAIYLAVMAAVFAVLRLVASGVMRLARRLPRPRATGLRMALANIHRPGALTPSLVLSLGLGVALLAALTTIDASVKAQLTGNLPARAPSFFFLDIPSRETERFDAFLQQRMPGAAIERVPMMRGRIVSLAGVPADEVRTEDRFNWVLDGDRGITYAAAPPPGTEIVEGRWWAPDHRGEPEVSFDAEIAAGLGLKIGDAVAVNVLGRTVTARLAATRKVEWRGLGINFVMVFSPNSFAGAPHTHLATLTVPGGSTTEQDAALLRALTADFPSVTAVRVKDAIEATNDLVARLALAIRIASGVAILASLLVLAGALAAGQTARLYDAMILKTLGATRGRIIGIYALEYALIGLISAAFGLLAGIAAGWAVVTRAMNIDFAFDLPGTTLVAIATIVVATGFGLVGTLNILKRKPASYLKSL